MASEPGGALSGLVARAKRNPLVTAMLASTAFMILGGLFVLFVLTAGGANSSTQYGVPPALPGPNGCAPHGTVLHISASGIAFNKRCLAAPANTPFTIVFQNRDAGIPHDVTVLPGASHVRDSHPLFHGPTVTGPATTVYHVGPLPPGTYYFVCVVHPWTMRGTFIVH